MTKMRLLCLLVACVVLSSCRSTSMSEANRMAVVTWKRGYLDVQDGDRLMYRGEDRQAMFYYERAIGYFKEVKTKYPTYEPEVVDYRLAYCESKITELVAKHTNDITFYTWEEFNQVIQEVKAKHSAALKQNRENAAKRAEAELMKAEK